jgi:hypothetical protein
MACGSCSPTAPSPPQVSGFWSGTLTTMSVTGGECFASGIQSSPQLGRVWYFTMSMTQDGGAVTATSQYPPGIPGSGEPDHKCSWTGTAGSNGVSLSTVTQNCKGQDVLGASCPDNRALGRQIRLAMCAVTATVSNNTVAGTEVDTSNVLDSMTQTVVGTIITTYNFSLTR